VILPLYWLLGSLAQRSSSWLGLAWSELFLLGLPACVAAAGSNLEVRRALRLVPRPPARVVALALPVGVAGFLAAGALMGLTSLLLPPRWSAPFDLSRLFDRPPLERAALALIAAVVAPLCEEVAFRGWLLTALLTRHRAAVATALCGLFFAVMHLDPVRFPALLALGCLYAWLTWRAGSVWPAVVAHAVNNGLGAALAATDPTAIASGRGSPPDALPLLLTLAAGSAALLALAPAYRRATPVPPPDSGSLVRRDPADPSTAFSPRRVPAALLAAASVGLAGLVALLLLAPRAPR